MARSVATTFAPRHARASATSPPLPSSSTRRSAPIVVAATELSSPPLLDTAVANARALSQQVAPLPPASVPRGSSQMRSSSPSSGKVRSQSAGDSVGRIDGVTDPSSSALLWMQSAEQRPGALAATASRRRPFCSPNFGRAPLSEETCKRRAGKRTAVVIRAH